MCKTPYKWGWVDDDTQQLVKDCDCPYEMDHWKERAKKAEDILTKVFKWQVEREGDVHLMLMGEMEWDENKCPLCDLDIILDDIYGIYERNTNG